MGGILKTVNVDRGCWGSSKNPWWMGLTLAELVCLTILLIALDGHNLRKTQYIFWNLVYLSICWCKTDWQYSHKKIQFHIYRTVIKPCISELWKYFFTFLNRTKPRIGPCSCCKSTSDFDELNYKLKRHRVRSPMR